MAKVKKVPVRKIWFVKHPLDQYEEDVKTLARMNNVRIIDVKFAEDCPDDMLAPKMPKLTSLVEKRKAAQAKAADDQAKADEKQAATDKEAQIERDIRIEIEVRARVMKDLAKK